MDYYFFSILDLVLWIIWVYGLLNSELPLARCQPLKIQDLKIRYFFGVSAVFLIFLPEISHKRLLQSLLYFLEELNKIFQMHLNILFKLRLIFCGHQ